MIAPDAILARAFDEQPQLLLAILERQAKIWGNCPLPDLLDAVDRAGVPDFVGRVLTGRGRRH